MLKYAIIGLGGLGKTHFRAYEEVRKVCDEVKLVALCDIRKEVFTTSIATNLGEDTTSKDYSDYNIYYNVDDLLENEQLDFAVIVVPTYLHEELAVKFMNKGIHVFCEKPMAISIEAAKNMLDTAKANGVKLMIGQCVRYDDSYQKLKEIIDSGKYGKVVRAHFFRISGTPSWGWSNWYLDETKSGGAALDLHVHDVDFINYLFGMPKSVTSFATSYKSKHDSMLTRYEYEGMLVTATGEWGCPSLSYPFNAGFFVKLETATVETRNGKTMLFTEAGDKIDLNPPVNDYKAAEVIDFIDCIKNDKISELNPVEDSFNTIRIAFAEKRSADSNKPVVIQDLNEKAPYRPKD